MAEGRTAAALGPAAAGAEGRAAVALGVWSNGEDSWGLFLPALGAPEWRCRQGMWSSGAPTARRNEPHESSPLLSLEGRGEFQKLGRGNMK